MYPCCIYYFFRGDDDEYEMKNIFKSGYFIITLLIMALKSDNSFIIHRILN